MFIHHVNCPYCNSDILIDFSDNIYDEYTRNREEYEETVYEIESEDNICPICNNKFDISGIIIEYPEGEFNYCDFSTIKPW